MDDLINFNKESNQKQLQIEGPDQLLSIQSDPFSAPKETRKP